VFVAPTRGLYGPTYNVKPDLHLLVGHLGTCCTYRRMGGGTFFKVGGGTNPSQKM